ncbi:Def N-formylmethionyl-tRNA deformylase [uncultured Caudovirales phage]|uniref:Def N-formylmethionyl-tRNA deformylase n=1 Tax=uncultured Caudovirales phage TaxID=2100421 RepID=A0A6J5KPV1_9CAUD|nr:Def N-formylmethionyl-tRNA deformylase [uncultured Caudovirales phage]
MGIKKIKFVDDQMYSYEIHTLVDSYSDIMRQKLEPFDFSNPPVDPRYLAISLIETMVKYRGVGLAANQVGFPYRVFVMGAQNVGFACFNPEIISVSGEESFEEGCLSFPGMFLPIKRPSSVTARYIDMNGVAKEETFTGFTARIFLHEYDHMEGVVYTSKVNQLTVDRAKRKIKNNLKLLNKEKREVEARRKEGAA